MIDLHTYVRLRLRVHACNQKHMVCHHIYIYTYIHVLKYIHVCMYIHIPICIPFLFTWFYEVYTNIQQVTYQYMISYFGWINLHLPTILVFFPGTASYCNHSTIRISHDHDSIPSVLWFLPIFLTDGPVIKHGRKKKMLGCFSMTPPFRFSEFPGLPSLMVA